MKNNILLFIGGLAGLVFTACKTQEQAGVAKSTPGSIQVANEAEVPMVVEEPAESVAAYRQSQEQDAKSFVSDADFAAWAIEMSMAQIKMGMLAERKGDKGAVRSLGIELQEEHLRVNGLLMEIARENNWQVPQALTEGHQAAVKELQNLDQEKFDSRYIEQLVQDHEAKLAFFKEASDKLTNSRLKNYIIQTTPTALEYLERAREIRKKLSGK